MFQVLKGGTELFSHLPKVTQQAGLELEREQLLSVGRRRKTDPGALCFTLQTALLCPLPFCFDFFQATSALHHCTTSLPFSLLCHG